jgi:hypothetical protein
LLRAAQAGCIPDDKEDELEKMLRRRILDEARLPYTLWKSTRHGVCDGINIDARASGVIAKAIASNLNPRLHGLE